MKIIGKNQYDRPVIFHIQSFYYDNHGENVIAEIDAYHCQLAS